MSKLVSSLKTIIWVLFVCCYVFFSLRYLLFRKDLGKTGSLASWFVSFFFFQPRITLAKVCSCHLCKAFPLALLSVVRMSLWGFLLWCQIMGEITKKKVQSCSQSFRAAHFSHRTLGEILCSMELSSFLIVTVVFLQHMLHLVKKKTFLGKLLTCLGKWRCFNK